MPTTYEEEVFLQPPQHQKYVRSFLFSRRINAPFVRVHLIARALLIFALTSVTLRTINTLQPDPVGTSILFVGSLLMFLLSGLRPQAARLYLLLTLSPLLSLFATWVLFNPVRGQRTFLEFPIYNGYIAIVLAFWEVVWLLIVVCYVILTKKFFLGFCLATVLAFLFARLIPLPSITITQVHFYHPLQVLISDKGILVAGTKIVGYAGMVFATIALVVTSRDVELIGTLRQLHVPQPIIFFVGTVFRSLDLALADYTIIRQAQRARTANGRTRSLVQQVSDLAGLSVPLIATMLRRSSEMGDALIVRGYTLSAASKDFYEASPLRPLDWLFIVISGVLLIFSVTAHPTVTSLLGWQV